jgi:hypothetical protein
VVVANHLQPLARGFLCGTAVSAVDAGRGGAWRYEIAATYFTGGTPALPLSTRGTPTHPDKSDRDKWGHAARATPDRRHAKLRACLYRSRPCADGGVAHSTRQNV